MKTKKKKEEKIWLNIRERAVIISQVKVFDLFKILYPALYFFFFEASKIVDKVGIGIMLCNVEGCRQQTVNTKIRGA